MPHANGVGGGSPVWGGGGGASSRGDTLTQGRGNAAKNCRERRRGRRSGGGGGGGGACPGGAGVALAAGSLETTRKRGGGGGRTVRSPRAPLSARPRSARARRGGVEGVGGGGSGGGGGGSPAPPARPVTRPRALFAVRGSRAEVALVAGGGGGGAARGDGGRVPSTRGGAAHQRWASGLACGRASEAGRARPSHADKVAAPARRSCGSNTLHPGATLAGTGGHIGSQGAPRCPSWPEQQQRLMPHRSFVHCGQEGELCTRHMAPSVPLPCPGGRCRCAAASGTLEVCIRGGRRA